MIDNLVSVIRSINTSEESDKGDILTLLLTMGDLVVVTDYSHNCKNGVTIPVSPVDC